MRVLLWTSLFLKHVSDGGAGMELLIPLNSQDSKPLYEQIYQFIKDEIRSGSLKPQKKTRTNLKKNWSKNSA